MTISYLSLGSNLDNPLKQLMGAINEISTLINTCVLKQSHFYWTPFMGSQAKQADVLNAVIAIETKLSPTELLKNLMAIELQHGRQRETLIGYSGRTLDIDILLYGNKIINTLELNLPHPRMYQRPFVMFPLAEITPNLCLPSGVLISEIIKTLEWNGRKANIYSI